jgi:hypothetical protein
MERNETTAFVQETMLDFAASTGLEPSGARPRRYLWTDAFAVCNYLELFCRTNDETWRGLALRLVDQVHHILGRHRHDDPRTGWISSLDEKEGELHQTRGGMRIGKQLNERRPDEPLNESLEWDRDGQYYHYLTKWMHALNRVSRVTGDPKYTGWAVELAQAAHARFTYRPPYGGRKRMYWKMSIDLTRPLVPSLGQHDPLDGFVTYSELQLTAATDFGRSLRPGLGAEIADMADMCRGTSWATDDPLSIGGLLSDASRVAQLMMKGGSGYAGLLESVVESALLGIESFTQGSSLGLPAEYRLAFRELGLSIGLAGVGQLLGWIEDNPGLFGGKSLLRPQAESLMAYVPLGETINRFWTDGRNREAGTWKEHRDINMVMLATSLAPEGFLTI